MTACNRYKAEQFNGITNFCKNSPGYGSSFLKLYKEEATVGVL